MSKDVKFKNFPSLGNVFFSAICLNFESFLIYAQLNLDLLFTSNKASFRFIYFFFVFQTFL